MPPPSQSTEIEVEVVEIDGIAPVDAARASGEADAPRGSFGRGWQQARQFDPRRIKLRWWPLWVLGAIVAVVLFLTLGLAAAIVLLVLRLVSGLLRNLLR